ncbi:MAG: carbohydrate ABC transporter permease [Acidimicrobiia bacterium]
MTVEKASRGPGPPGLGLEGRSVFRARPGAASERVARAVFIWPALLVLFLMSIFPLLVSLYLSLSRLQLVPGGFDIRFIGLQNFRTLFLGSEQTHFLGLMRPPSPLGWVAFGAGLGLLSWGLIRALQGGVSPLGMVFRLLGALLGAAALWLLVRTLLSEGGRPGTVVVTLIYVFVGVAVQFAVGLGLAYLVTQGLPGQRLFRIVFLLPMMITPVGVAYMFRMLTDTSKGPFQPIWSVLGLSGFSWVNDPWGARAAVMVGDIWQWIPFMFIVLVAALEAQDLDTVEAALVDGANRWQIFRHITLPGILPVGTTVVLIRIIEAFKIIDLPNVLTNGGPGTATESLTLHAYIRWRSLDLGQSAAVAYSLLFIVTVVAVAYVNLLRRRFAEA